MRYSMVVYIIRMCRTLIEADQYLRRNPFGAEHSSILKNGHTMIRQIQDILEQYNNELRSTAVQEYVTILNRIWGERNNEAADILNTIIQSLPKEVYCQVRAVFFAELGEKWDSMESVYEFMRDDPRFDPIIVRTPVGRVVGQGENQKQDVIYKDFLTPLGIPSLDYRQYSLEKDCPDLAFISQPYEGGTIQQFWPENISKYTRLVYLPYYLPDMVQQSSINAQCQLMVYRYAWKIICPTEKQLRFYQKHAANGGSNALLTGMPKLDHLVTLRETGTEFPTSWEHIRGKKIFLWNSWYVAGNSTLRFSDEILAWFEEHLDCALIWRPHPMTDTVTKLYSPEQYPKYTALIQRVRNMPNAVLDEMTSYKAAFYYSIAQISDYSSLLPQYLLMDKPALMVRNDKVWQFTGEEFISSQWMEQTDCVSGIYSFLNRICQGEDRNARLRRKVIQQDLSLADGHSGERVCERIWDAMWKEDFSLFHSKRGL